MLDKAAAIKRVTEVINADRGIENELVVVDEATIDKDYGWVFFYNSKKYLETGEFSHRVVGNGPVIVNREDGSIHVFGTYEDPEEFIKNYESTITK